MPRAIVDTGPLVAFFDRSERHHDWAAAQIEALEAPLLVCEPVLAEACYLLARFQNAQDALLALLQNGALQIAFEINEHVGELRKLMQKYRDTPMSLADACILQMAEMNEQHFVFTLDSDFTVYRKRARTPLALIHPGMA